jgi:hypothetical protein
MQQLEIPFEEIEPPYVLRMNFGKIWFDERMVSLHCGGFAFEHRKSEEIDGVLTIGEWYRTGVVMRWV